MTLPEEQQAAAVRRLTDALEIERAAMAEVRAAAAAARDVGVSINRIGALAEASRDKVLGWIRIADESKSPSTKSTKRAAPGKKSPTPRVKRAAHD